MPKLIPLTKGYFAIVDDDDFEELNKFKWYVRISKHTNYAVRNSPWEEGKRTTIIMHRVILNSDTGTLVDHINGNGLDNRKENLRFCTRAENAMNAKKYERKRSSDYKGVQYYKSRNKYRARITISKKETHLGFFNTEKEAAKAYNEAAIKYFGEFAKVNKI